MSCCSVIPLTLDDLSKKCSEKTLSHGVASVATFLRNGIIAKAEKDQSDNFFKCLLGYFQSKCEEAIVTKLIEKNISTWRSALLETTTSEFAFSRKDFSKSGREKRECVYIATSRMIEFVTAGSFQRLAVTIRWNMNLVCSLRLHPYSPFAASHDHIIEQFMRPLQKKTSGK